jgi:hypothetical protein
MNDRRLVRDCSRDRGVPPWLPVGTDASLSAEVWQEFDA